MIKRVILAVMATTVLASGASAGLLGQDSSTWSPYTQDGEYVGFVGKHETEIQKCGSDPLYRLTHRFDYRGYEPLKDATVKIQANFFDDWGKDIKDGAEAFGDFVKSGPDAVKGAGEDVGDFVTGKTV